MSAHSGVPSFAELQAPPAWRTLDFVSDLHLHGSQLEAFEAWRAYMRETPADAVFMLGDLFDAWPGDDAAALPGFAADCCAVLHAAGARMAVFFMAGNRDFLIGEIFLSACRTTALADPTVLGFGGRRWLLTHGDALCIADKDYMVFREKVRAPAWQQEFLARPLRQREAIASDLRRQSEDRKTSVAEYVDVDDEAARDWLTAADAQVLIHGHTHRPGEHDLGAGCRRVVLSDWDLRAQPPRQQVLRLTCDGLRRIDLT